jgi:hypothetical protein
MGEGDFPYERDEVTNKYAKTATMLRAHLPFIMSQLLDCNSVLEGNHSRPAVGWPSAGRRLAVGWPSAGRRLAVGALFFALSLFSVNRRHPLSIIKPYFSLSFGKCRTIKPLFPLFTGCRALN